jgi:DNA-binding IclR family transcriptional regulator
MRDPIIELFAEALTGLRDASGETVILGTRQADKVVYLDVRQSNAVIRYSAQPGDLKPLHSSAIGKLLLGEMPESERRKTMARLTLSRVTDSTLADPETLWNELEDGRRAGCYVTRGENVAEVMALACPVRVTSDVFGVALAGPIQRMERRVDELRSLLLEATAEVNGWAAT